VLDLTLTTGPWSQSSFAPRPGRLGPAVFLLYLRRFPLWPPWTSCTGHLPFPHQPLNLVGSYLCLPTPELGIPLRESPGSSFVSSVLIGLIPDLTLLPFLLQTSLHTPETEKPSPHLPPTPTPLAITTTVTMGGNATVLQVGRKWMVLGQGRGGEGDGQEQTLTLPLSSAGVGLQY